MPKHTVDIQTVDGNDSRLSITGTVDGKQVATTVPRDSIPLRDSAYRDALLGKNWPQQVRIILATALVSEDNRRRTAPPHPGMISVEAP